jgi:nucleoside-diphosphate-sugar epimerase
MSAQRTSVFITGGTGYIGSRLILRLLERGHDVRALVRDSSIGKLPHGCTPIIGNALDSSTFINQIKPASTFIQLVGVAHPSPSKAEEFEKVDLVYCSINNLNK